MKIKTKATSLLLIVLILLPTILTGCTQGGEPKETVSIPSSDIPSLGSPVFMHNITDKNLKDTISAHANGGINVNVKKGDTFLICGGQPHAIGTGCLMIEIQEPTDYTIKVQRVTSAGKLPDEACHQGLGFEKMFDCFDYGGLSREETLKRWYIPPTAQKREGYVQTQLVGYGDTPMFAMELLETAESFRFTPEGTFSGLYVLEGEGTLDGKKVRPGDQFFLPAACLPFDVKSETPLKLLHIHGPKA